MQFDVIVLGGGAAGLAAARDLTGAGKRVCLLEARDRLGGRMHTLHLAGVPMPIEFGAEFVHGASQTAFSIVDSAGLLLHELPDVHWWSRDGNLQIIDDYWQKMDRLRTQIGGTSDQSFADFLRSRRGLPSRLRELALGYVEGYHAAHADRISAQSIASSDEEQDDPGGNQQFRIANGYDSVVSWLRAGITPERAEVRTATTALEVRWSDGEVMVRCRGTRGGEEEELHARVAVITLPIGVLKAPPEQPGSLRFTPELREKRRVLDRLEIGHVVKIIFRFRERFWDEPSFLSDRASAKDRKRGPVNFLHSSDRWITTWWTTAPARTPMLTAWSGGHAADRLLAEGEESMIDRALDSMTRAFRMERRTLDGLLAGAHLHNWQSDPFSRGAYSYAAVGGSEAPGQLARPVKSTLFFAGEATNAEETGTVMGAIDSGRRAAKEVLARVK